MVQKFPVRENSEFGNFAQTQGILDVQVVTSLILRIKGIAIFAVNIQQMFLETECVCHVSFVYKRVINHRNWHREKLWLDGKIRENSWEFENGI